MEISRQPVTISKTTFLYGVIAILILIIFGKGIFASDEDTMKDSLSAIDSYITQHEAYKQKVIEDYIIKTTELNDNIYKECAKIPEKLKSGIDCKKYFQVEFLTNGDFATGKEKMFTNTGTSTGGIAPVPERQGTDEEINDPTLRAALNLKDCRFTNAKHKFPKDKISFQAVDIACVKGESFSVYTPNWKDEYTVTSIGYGTNMGNYIILKNGDYHFVYGHTVASPDLKVGDKLRKGVYIGKTNVSGESTGMHLHFELWEGGENINGRFIVGDKVIYSPDSQKLLDKRKWNWGDIPTEKKYWEAYEKTITILHREEGLGKMGTDGLVHAYPDYKGCSIGYGSRANSCDEAITVAEANSRLAYVVRDLVDRIQKHYPRLDTDAQASITSFAFNCHQGYLDIVANGLQKHQIWCKKAGGVRLEALVDRRADEWKFISKDPAYKFYSR